MSTDKLSQSYEYCLDRVRNHYENFPVASRLLPKRLRLPIAAIYAFARNADDFADEDQLAPDERIKRLDDYRDKLGMLQRGESVEDPVFIALNDTIKRHQLPWQLFYDLLDAFTQDVTKIKYENFKEVMDYCRLSANPVGRLLLHLHNEASPQNLAWSDNICSALQLINHWQDFGQDYHENNRVYLPVDEMKKCGVTEDHLRELRTDDAMRKLVQLQIDRSRKMMLSGKPLGHALRGRFGFEIRLIIQGGLAILNALEHQNNDVFSRPRLSRKDWIAMSWKACWKKC
jgi:squalene synthase HpnC